jgi:hypothetical protein
MDNWFPGAGFVGADEVIVGLSDAGTPLPITVGIIAELQARLGWAFAVCSRERPGESQGMEIRRLNFCPHCGEEARGFLGIVTLNDGLVGGAGAIVGSCPRCGSLR